MMKKAVMLGIVVILFVLFSVNALAEHSTVDITDDNLRAQVLEEDHAEQDELVAFFQEVETIIQEIKDETGVSINPMHLLIVMDFESYDIHNDVHFSPSVQNPTSTKATGLIQITKSNAIKLGTTVDDLKEMSRIEQLEYVKQYFLDLDKFSQIRENNLGDVAMAIFAPSVGIGKVDTYPIYQCYTPPGPNDPCSLNPGADRDGDNRITRLDYLDFLKKISYRDTTATSIFEQEIVPTPGTFYFTIPEENYAANVMVTRRGVVVHETASNLREPERIGNIVLFDEDWVTTNVLTDKESIAAINHFSYSAAKTSAHMIVSRSGQIFMAATEDHKLLADERIRAYHAGAVGNDLFGVEFSVPKDGSLTDEQKSVLKDEVIDYFSTFGPHIYYISHKQISDFYPGTTDHGDGDIVLDALEGVSAFDIYFVENKEDMGGITLIGTVDTPVPEPVPSTTPSTTPPTTPGPSVPAPSPPAPSPSVPSPPAPIELPSPSRDAETSEPQTLGDLGFAAIYENNGLLYFGANNPSSLLYGNKLFTLENGNLRNAPTSATASNSIKLCSIRSASSGFNLDAQKCKDDISREKYEEVYDLVRTANTVLGKQTAPIDLSKFSGAGTSGGTAARGGGSAGVVDGGGIGSGEDIPLAVEGFWIPPSEQNFGAISTRKVPVQIGGVHYEFYHNNVVGRTGWGRPGFVYYSPLAARMDTFGFTIPYDQPDGIISEAEIEEATTKTSAERDEALELFGILLNLCGDDCKDIKALPLAEAVVAISLERELKDTSGKIVYFSPKDVAENSAKISSVSGERTKSVQDYLDANNLEITEDGDWTVVKKNGEERSRIEKLSLGIVLFRTPEGINVGLVQTSMTSSLSGRAIAGMATASGVGSVQGTMSINPNGQVFAANLPQTAYETRTEEVDIGGKRFYQKKTVSVSGEETIKLFSGNNEVKVMQGWERVDPLALGVPRGELFIDGPVANPQLYSNEIEELARYFPDAIADLRRMQASVKYGKEVTSEELSNGFWVAPDRSMIGAFPGEEFEIADYPQTNVVYTLNFAEGIIEEININGVPTNVLYHHPVLVQYDVDKDGIVSKSEFDLAYADNNCGSDCISVLENLQAFQEKGVVALPLTEALQKIVLARHQVEPLYDNFGFIVGKVPEVVWPGVDFIGGLPGTEGMVEQDVTLFTNSYKVMVYEEMAEDVFGEVYYLPDMELKNVNTDADTILSPKELKENGAQAVLDILSSHPGGITLKTVKEVAEHYFSSFDVVNGYLVRKELVRGAGGEQWIPPERGVVGGDSGDAVQVRFPGAVTKSVNVIGDYLKEERDTVTNQATTYLYPYSWLKEVDVNNDKVIGVVELEEAKRNGCLGCDPTPTEVLTWHPQGLFIKTLDESVQLMFDNGILVVDGPNSLKLADLEWAEPMELDKIGLANSAVNHKEFTVPSITVNIDGREVTQDFKIIISDKYFKQIGSEVYLYQSEWARVMDKGQEIGREVSDGIISTRELKIAKAAEIGRVVSEKQTIYDRYLWKGFIALPLQEAVQELVDGEALFASGERLLHVDEVGEQFQWVAPDACIVGEDIGDVDAKRIELEGVEYTIHIPRTILGTGQVREGRLDYLYPNEEMRRLDNSPLDGVLDAYELSQDANCQTCGSFRQRHPQGFRVEQWELVIKDMIKTNELVNVEPLKLLLCKMPDTVAIANDYCEIGGGDGKIFVVSGSPGSEKTVTVNESILGSIEINSAMVDYIYPMNLFSFDANKNGVITPGELNDADEEIQRRYPNGVLARPVNDFILANAGVLDSFGTAESYVCRKLLTPVPSEHDFYRRANIGQDVVVKELNLGGTVYKFRLNPAIFGDDNVGKKDMIYVSEFARSLDATGVSESDLSTIPPDGIVSAGEMKNAGDQAKDLLQANPLGLRALTLEEALVKTAELDTYIVDAKGNEIIFEGNDINRPKIVRARPGELPEAEEGIYDLTSGEPVVVLSKGKSDTFKFKIEDKIYQLELLDIIDQNSEDVPVDYTSIRYLSRFLIETKIVQTSPISTSPYQIKEQDLFPSERTLVDIAPYGSPELNINPTVMVQGEFFKISFTLQRHTAEPTTETLPSFNVGEEIPSELQEELERRRLSFEIDGSNIVIKRDNKNVGEIRSNEVTVKLKTEYSGGETKKILIVEPKDKGSVNLGEKEYILQDNLHDVAFEINSDLVSAGTSSFYVKYINDRSMIDEKIYYDGTVSNGRIIDFQLKADPTEKVYYSLVGIKMHIGEGELAVLHEAFPRPTQLLEDQAGLVATREKKLTSAELMRYGFISANSYCDDVVEVCYYFADYGGKGDILEVAADGSVSIRRRVDNCELYTIKFEGFIKSMVEMYIDTLVNEISDQKGRHFISELAELELVDAGLTADDVSGDTVDSLRSNAQARGATIKEGEKCVRDVEPSRILSGDRFEQRKTHILDRYCLSSDPTSWQDLTDSSTISCDGVPGHSIKDIELNNDGSGTLTWKKQSDQAVLLTVEFDPLEGEQLTKLNIAKIRDLSGTITGTANSDTANSFLLSLLQRLGFLPEASWDYLIDIPGSTTGRAASSGATMIQVAERLSSLEEFLESDWDSLDLGEKESHWYKEMTPLQQGFFGTIDAYYQFMSRNVGLAHGVGSDGYPLLVWDDENKRFELFRGEFYSKDNIIDARWYGESQSNRGFENTTRIARILEHNCQADIQCKAYYATAEMVAAPGAPEAAPLTAISREPGCLSIDCKKIDEVWALVRVKLGMHEAFGLWDTNMGWVATSASSFYTVSAIIPETRPIIIEDEPGLLEPSPGLEPEVRTLGEVIIPTSGGDATILVGIYNKYKTFIDTASTANGNFDKATIASVIYKESRGNPTATSGVGAVGLMQLMPMTAQQYGLNPSERTDPEKNINAGVKYLAALKARYRADELVLAAYNGGDVAVEDSSDCPGQKKYQCLWDNAAHSVRNTGYQQTRDYVTKVTAYINLITNNKLLHYELINTIDGVKCNAVVQCILTKKTKEALVIAAEKAKEKGYALLLNSGFRTIEEQRQLYSDNNGRGTCNPDTSSGCPHVKGIAVDVTLMKNNVRLSPSEIGCMGAKCAIMAPQFATYPAQKDLSDIMKAAGFTPLPSEWWHFEKSDGAVS